MKFDQFKGKRFNTIRVAGLFCAMLMANSLLGMAQSTGKIAFVNNVDNTTEIFSINADGTNRTRVSFNNIRELPYFDITRDGSLVVFQLFATNDLYVMNSDGSSVRQLTFFLNIATANQPAFSPDGTQVAFTCDLGGNPDIYLINVDGTNLRRVTTHAGIDSRPSFTPDGARILFDSNRNGPFFLPNLYLINVDGTNETRLTNFYEFGGRYSPDGSRIVYQGRTVERQDHENEIFIMNADGSNRTQLTLNEIKDQDPSFSLDGTLIAFDRDVTMPGIGTIYQIFTMNLNGGNVRQVTQFDATIGPSFNPKWIPAPTVQVSGRVTTPDGRGLRNATVSITDSNNVIRRATTSSFGFFSFDNVITGQTYTVRISSRLFRYSPQTFQVNGNLTLPDFVGLE